ncbi:MAG TPA: TolC family protein [Candidatus Dormibacteraeota bacterium]|nr:TolC family protein [Candidatus Dormibacteraeota bacterium]
MKTTYSLLFNLILALTFRAAQAGDNGSTVREGRLSLDEVTNVVLANNPTIKAAQEKWRAMKARVPQAAAWEDLRAEARSRVARYVSIPPNAFTDQSFKLQQEVPISGKNLSRARAVTAEAGAAFEDFRRTQLDVLSRARAAFHRLANEYAQLDVNQRNVDLLNQFAEVNRQRYEVGNATQADVLTAQTDAAKLLEAQSDIFRRISDAQSQLNVLMNRPAQLPLAEPSQIPFQAPHFSLQALQSVALSARPEMQRAQNRVEAERFRVELANRQRFPDPTLDVQAQRYNEAGQAVSELDVGVSVPLPFANPKKYSAGVTEARRNFESAQHELEAARTETLGLVRDQLKKIETAAHHYELYSDKILPLARQAVQSNRVAYETSSANFLELITAQRVLQDVESMHVNHLADYQVAVAELGAIVGIEDWLPSKNSAERRKSK